MQHWFDLAKGGTLLAVGGEELLSYEELSRRADRLAGLLRDNGVGPGAVVCSLLANSPEFVVALAATWRLGAVFAPLDPQLTAVERKRLLDLAGPAAVIDSHGCQAAERTALPSEPAPGENDALLLFTSGSTGAPKGVLLSATAVQAGVTAVADTFRLSSSDRTLALLPWTHGHGLVGVLLATLCTGGTIDLEAGPVPAAVASDMLARASWLSVVPPTLALLCDRQASRPSGARLRFIRTASAPLPASLATRAEMLFQCPAAEAYGMTETCHQAAANPPDWSRQLGCVGMPSGTSFREVGEAMGGGRELEVTGPALFRGYLGRADLTEEAVTIDGWYRTRDIGVILPDGVIRLVGRTSEIINRGGFKVSPAEVEESLASHPGVSASLVAAVPHSVLGEEIGALVVVRQGTPLSVGDLQRHCRQYLAAYKQPGLIRIVDEIPRLPNGKPSRRLASELLQSAS